MIKIEAIVREEKLEDVKEALQKIEVRGLTVSQVMGCGTQMGYTENVRGSRVHINMLPKIKFEIIVSMQSKNPHGLETLAMEKLSAMKFIMPYG